MFRLFLQISPKTSNPKQKYPSSWEETTLMKVPEVLGTKLLLTFMPTLLNRLFYKTPITVIILRENEKSLETRDLLRYYSDPAVILKQLKQYFPRTRCFRA